MVKACKVSIRRSKEVEMLAERKKGDEKRNEFGCILRESAERPRNSQAE